MPHVKPPKKNTIATAIESVLHLPTGKIRNSYLWDLGALRFRFLAIEVLSHIHKNSSTDIFRQFLCYSAVTSRLTLAIHTIGFWDEEKTTTTDLIFA